MQDYCRPGRSFALCNLQAMLLNVEFTGSTFNLSITKQLYSLITFEPKR